MKTNKGFTMAEIVVSLLVIAVIATITLPTFTRIKPNKEHIMFRKAYYLISNLVYELVNDENLYPEPAEANQYFHLGNTSEALEDGEIYSGETKFCKLMISRLNTVPNITTSCVEKPNFTDGNKPEGQFKTNDGMVWILPISKFDNPDKHYNYPIYIDVNGDKMPNCIYKKDVCDNPDRFTVFIKRDGRLTVEGKKEIEYLEETNVSKN